MGLSAEPGGGPRSGTVRGVLVLSVCSLKGGVGKTSVVLGLASAALKRGVPTLVLDLDPQADATIGLDGPIGVGRSIADVLADPRAHPLEQLTVPSAWVTGTGEGAAGEHSTGEHGTGANGTGANGTGPAPGGVLDLVPGSPDAADHEFGRAAKDKALGRLQQALVGVTGYELVLIDCPPSFGSLTRNALVASHRAIVVTEPALFSVTAADRALRAVDQLRRGRAPQLQPLGVLVNRFRDRSPEHRYRIEELSQLFGPLVLSPAVPERSALQQAQGASQPIHRWPGPAARELGEAFDHHLARVLRTGERVGRAAKGPRQPAR